MKFLIIIMLATQFIFADVNQLLEARYFKLNQPGVKYDNAVVSRYQVRYQDQVFENYKFLFSGSVYGQSGFLGNRDLDSLKETGILEALYIERSSAEDSLKFGRQFITLGVSRFYLPFNNVFNQINVTDPWQELTGKEALNYTRYFDAYTSVSLICAQENYYPDKTYTMIYKTTYGLTELHLYLLDQYQFEEKAYGLTLKGEQGVGWWVETKTTFNKDRVSTGETVLGLDYTFDLGESLYVSWENVRNGYGAETPADYPTVTRTSYKNKNYNIVSLRQTINEDLLLNVLDYYSHDNSFMLNSFIDYIYSDYLKFICGSTAFYGAKDGEFSPKRGSVVYGFIQYNF